MGVDYHQYIGPFFKCRCEVKTKYLHVSACINDACKRFKLVQTGNFCSECGHALGEIKQGMKKVHSVNSHEVMEALDEKLYVPGSNYGPLEKTADSETHCFIPNIYPKNPIVPAGFKNRKFSNDESESIQAFDDNWTAQCEIDYLKQNFSKEEEILRKSYGDNNVKVCWGIINYAN